MRQPARKKKAGFIFRTMKTQVGKALSFIFFIHLSSFFFPGRLRSGPHGVNHPCQAVDLVEHLPESHPAAALLPLLGWLSICPASLFICLSIPWSPDSRLPLPRLAASLSLPIALPLSRSLTLLLDKG